VARQTDSAPSEQAGVEDEEYYEEENGGVGGEEVRLHSSQLSSSHLHEVTLFLTQYVEE
jgi:hypothetical protein